MIDTFLVEYSTGSFDSWTRKPHFVTTDEQFAKDYCKKFNRILKRARTQYGLDDPDWIVNGRGLNSKYRCRQHRVDDFNEATYAKIETR